MRKCDYNTYEFILKHKEHFDGKLIEMVHLLDCRVNQLSDKNNRLKCKNQKLQQENKERLLKVKDLEALKYSSDQTIKELSKENDELMEYLKQIQKENEELRKRIEQHEKEIDQQAKEIKEYTTIVDKLKRMNSTNSNMPSSMDILGHSKPHITANKRGATTKKRGGQKNHPVHKSKLYEKVDEVINLKVKKAPTGAAEIKNKNGEIQYYATQEIDFILGSKIKETRYYIDENGKEPDQETMKKYAINPLTYSGDFKAMAVYLNQRGTIPLQRLVEMMKEISKGSIQLQTATISKWCRECHKKSEETRKTILKEITDKEVVHVDETGMKISGKPYWIHTITNEKGSYFVITKQRGDKEKGPIHILDTYTGVLVHDHFKPYQKLKLCKHGECNAHIDRYMKAGIEFYDSKECREVIELMHEMLHKKKELIKNGKSNMSKQEVEAYERKYMEILEKGQKQNEGEKTNKKYEPEYVKTFRRMMVYKEDHLRFIKDFKVPYTNNKAERQCRAVKAKKKTSGQFVSETGGETYVGILSLLQTAKLRKENAFEVLRAVFQ